MKKIITIFTAMLLAVSLSAQNKNEITLSYSQITLPQTAYVTAGIFGVAFTVGHFQFDNTIFTGALGIEYTRNVNGWFAYGGLALFDYMTSDAYTVDDEGVKTYNGKFNLGYVSLMPVAKFRWFDNPHFGMYSKIGFGAGMVFNDSVDFGYSAQLSPVCMHFGGETIRGVVELGYGMQGIITVGIKKVF